ncbi:MAG: LacI family transcriptional regulator [Ancrocorticia sp.]|nr:LacI family transcriptional regulator [Ancrocorticia sp.]
MRVDPAWRDILDEGDGGGMAEGGAGTSERGMQIPLRAGVKDVAREAGVSVGTVSNVLNRPDQVSPEARERVKSAVRKLGYVRNPHAQALRTGVSPLVGVAVLDLLNPFFMEAADGMERRLAEDACIMALTSTHSDPEIESHVLRVLSGQGVRGILLTPTDGAMKEVRKTVARGTRVVLFDTTATPKDVSSVSVDDKRGARLAIEHLLGLGHTRIAFFNGPDRVRQARDRQAGVEQAVGLKAGESVKGGRARSALDVVHLDSFTAEDGRLAAEVMLENARQADGTIDRMQLPTAIFCANDQIALGVTQVLQDHRVRIPRDVSVVGFDDTEVASQLSTPLTTVRQPMEELGWAAADILLSDSDEVIHRRFAPELVVRESTAPPCAAQ